MLMVFAFVPQKVSSAILTKALSLYCNDVDLNCIYNEYIYNKI